jgi:hypothetical protein
LQKFISYLASLKGVFLCGGGLRNAEKRESCLLQRSRKRAGCDGRRGDERGRRIIDEVMVCTSKRGTDSV